MTASLSGVFSVQQFTDLGDPLVGGRLYTYAAGTTTLKVAYTDAAASVPHTYTSDGIGGSYIALDARGELPAGLFLDVGAYDLALKTAAGATIWTRRAQGEGDSLRTDLASTASGEGASIVGIEDIGAYFRATQVEAALQEVAVELARGIGYNILRDILPAQWAAIFDGTTTYDVSAIVRTRVAALGANGRLYFPGKKYLFSTPDAGATISSYIRISQQGFTIIADAACTLTFTDGAYAGVYVDTSSQMFRFVGGLLYGTNTTTPTIELLRISAPYANISGVGFAYASICLNYLGVVGTGVYVCNTAACQFSNADQYVKVSGNSVADMFFFGNTYGTTSIGSNPAIEAAAPGCCFDDYWETQNHTKGAFRATTGAQSVVLRGRWLDSGEIEIQTSVSARIDIQTQDCYHTGNSRFLRIAGGATADTTGSEFDGNGSAGGITGVSSSGTWVMGSGAIKQFQTAAGFAGQTTLGNVLFNANGTAVSANSGASGEGCGLIFSGNTTDATLNSGSTFQLNRKASAAASPAGGGTVTPNLASGNTVVVTMPAGNITVAAPTNQYLNAELIMVFIQDATGGRTITWNAAFKKAADGVGGANGRGATRYVYDGTNWVQIGGALAFA